MFFWFSINNYNGVMVNDTHKQSQDKEKCFLREEM